jgi:hypothetical protein
MTWDEENLRRLTYAQALQPRDPVELAKFNKNHITIVVPSPDIKTIHANPETLKVLGCQWNLFDRQTNSFLVR